jgi:hypothetical protein
MTGRGMLRLSLLVAVASLSVGCEPKDDTFGCKPVDATGGPLVEADPTNPKVMSKTWLADKFCVAKYDRVTSNDWCSQIVWDMNGVRQAYLGHPELFVTAVGVDGKPTQLKLTQGPGLEDPTKTVYSYEADLKLSMTQATTTFPSACLTAYGQTADDCAVFGSALDMYLSDPSSAWQSFNLVPLQYQPFYPQGLLPQPSYLNMSCGPAADHNGCTCTYDVTLDIHDTGAWTNAKGSILSLYSDSAAPPFDQDYASDGSVLKMSGHDGLDVFGQRGLRTLLWRKQ